MIKVISPGEAIWYFEYLDHGKICSDPKELIENPLKLWCVGKIMQESEDFIAIVCSGTIGRLPSSEPSYEIILKKVITKQELIYVVK